MLSRLRLLSRLIFVFAPLVFPFFFLFGRSPPAVSVPVHVGRAEVESKPLPTDPIHQATHTATLLTIASYATTDTTSSVPAISTARTLSEPVGTLWQKLNLSNIPVFDLESGCGDRICSNFVSAPSKRCVKKIQTLPARSVSPTCRFRNGTSRPLVLLRSFPGSGNTWSRQLLEKATGICTGSVYCDSSVFKSGMIGEGIVNTSVLVVKTHERESLGESTIFIIRNPIDAIVSFWKWYLVFNKTWNQGEEHSANPPQKYFQNYPDWNLFVKKKSLLWVKMVENDFLSYSKHPVLMVQYENLKKNASREILRMLNFLQVNHSSDVVLKGNVTTFRRPKQADDFDPYTPQQRQLVRNRLVDLVRQLRERHKDSQIRVVEQYLSEMYIARSLFSSS